MSMNIVSLYAPPGGRGGLENVTLHLDKSLRNRGHRFITALAGPSSEDRSWEKLLSNVRIGSVESLSWKHLPISVWPFSQFIITLLNTEKPEIVMSNWAPMVMLLRVLQKIRLVRSSFSVIIYEHGDLGRLTDFSVSPIYRWAYRTGLKQSDHVVCGGTDYATVLQKHYGVPATAIGLPLTLPVTRIARSPSELFRIVFVGRLDNQQKRIDRLLKACAQIPDTVHWALQLVGDGPDRVLLKSMARDLRLEDHCTWSGWQSDPWSVIDSATILAFPSDHEGFSAVMIEAMARGVPVLATDCNFGPRGVIKEGINGWLTDRNDEAFAEQLCQLATGAISIPSQELVVPTVDRFSTEQVTDRFLTVCQNLLQSRHAP